MTIQVVGKYLFCSILLLQASRFRALSHHRKKLSRRLQALKRFHNLVWPIGEGG